MTTLDIRRKNSLNLFREASRLQPFDEFPVLRPEVDPQLHVSHGGIDQPFHLICAKDSMIALVSGRASVHFADASVRRFDLEPGDYVYVPAGVPHRITVREAGIQLRYKARESGLEAVAWLCHGCGSELGRHIWDNAVSQSQQEYLQACNQFNASAEGRRCPRCGEVHAEVDTRQFRWAEIAALLRDDATRN